MLHGLHVARGIEGCSQSICRPCDATLSTRCPDDQLVQMYRQCNHHDICSCQICGPHIHTKNSDMDTKIGNETWDTDLGHATPLPTRGKLADAHMSDGPWLNFSVHHSQTLVEVPPSPSSKLKPQKKRKNKKNRPWGVGEGGAKKRGEGNYPLPPPLLPSLPPQTHPLSLLATGVGGSMQTLRPTLEGSSVLWARLAAPTVSQGRWVNTSFFLCLVLLCPGTKFSLWVFS